MGKCCCKEVWYLFHMVQKKRWNINYDNNFNTDNTSRLDIWKQMYSIQSCHNLPLKDNLLICRRLMIKTSAGAILLTALHLYCPKSASLFSSTLTLLVLLVSCFSCEPPGLVHVITGTGTPSATHFSSTVWPIHEELSVEEVALSICALSVDYWKQRTSHFSITFPNNLPPDHIPPCHVTPKKK